MAALMTQERVCIMRFSSSRDRSGPIAESLLHPKGHPAHPWQLRLSLILDIQTQGSLLGSYAL